MMIPREGKGLWQFQTPKQSSYVQSSFMRRFHGPHHNQLDEKGLGLGLHSTPDPGKQSIS
jgi:hypothetical protein